MESLLTQCYLMVYFPVFFKANLILADGPKKEIIVYISTAKFLFYWFLSDDYVLKEGAKPNNSFALTSRRQSKHYCSPSSLSTINVIILIIIRGYIPC